MMGGAVRDMFGGIIGWRHGKNPISIMRAEQSDVEHIITANHYSGKPCQNSFCSLFVYHDEKGVT